METKGQLGGLKALIFVLIIAGVLIGAGFFILGEMNTSLDDESFSVSNKAGGFMNTSGYTLGQGTPGAHDCSVSLATNTTSGQTIVAANYTITNCIATNATSTVWGVVNFTYTYQGGEEAYTAVTDSMSAFMTVPDLLPLIVLIVIVVIILSLVFTIPGAKSSA